MNLRVQEILGDPAHTEDIEGFLLPYGLIRALSVLLPKGFSVQKNYGTTKETRIS